MRAGRNGNEQFYAGAVVAVAPPAHRQRAGGMYATEVYDIDGSTIATVDWYPVKTATGTITATSTQTRMSPKNGATVWRADVRCVT